MPKQIGVGEGVPSVADQQASLEAADAEMDTALDSIIGEDDPVSAQDDATTPKDGRAQDKTGKSAKKSAESKSDEPPEAPTDDATPEYDKALQSLKRDKVPQSALDNLSKEDVISWGSQRAESQLHTDRIQSRNTELERAKEILATPEPEADKAGDSVLDDALIEFGNYFGEDSSGPLKAFGEAILKKATAGQDAQREALAKIVSRIENQERQEAREAMSERYDLSDDSRWQEVVEYAKADANTHASVQDGLRAACRQLFADDIQDNLNSNLHAEHGKRSRGQPHAGHKSAPPTESKNNEDLEDTLLDNILDEDMVAAEKTGRVIGGRARKRGAIEVGRVGMS